MNRRARRAAAKVRSPQDQWFQQQIAKVQAAFNEKKRLQDMFQAAQEAAAMAAMIPEVSKPDGWTPEDGDPNAYRASLIAEAEERINEVRELLAPAALDCYDALKALEDDEPRIQVASATAIR